MLRVVLGIIFLAHGLAKIRMGVDQVADWFTSMGIPGFLAYVVASVELLGGIALILGIATYHVSLAICAILAVAILKVKLPVGLLGNGESTGYAFDLALIAIAIYITIVGDRGYTIKGLYKEYRSKK